MICAQVLGVGALAVGVVHEPALRESGRHERDRLDADVAAFGQARVDDLLGRAVGGDGPDQAAVLVGRDERAGEVSERLRRDGHPALDRRRGLGDHLARAPAVDREQLRLAGERRGDQEPVVESPRGVEGYAVEARCIDVGERACLLPRTVDAGQSDRRVQSQKVEVVAHEVTARGGDVQARRGLEVCLGVGIVAVAARPARERRQIAGRRQRVKRRRPGHDQRPVHAGSGQVENGRHGLPLLPRGRGQHRRRPQRDERRRRRRQTCREVFQRPC